MNDVSNVKILAFDVFGTVVDWHGSVAREVDQLNLDVDGGYFARAWRAGYQPAMAEVMAAGEWVILDQLHRRILDRVLEEFELTDRLDEDQIQNLNRVWHRLDPWPDSVAGLTRLKSRFTICSLSNGNLGLLTNMAKRAGLPWDCILSAEVFRKYKPHPDTYLGVARTFAVSPAEVMLVAAHNDDLAAARECGLATAYIERPLEYGVSHRKDVSPRRDNSLHAESITHLADLLACD